MDSYSVQILLHDLKNQLQKMLAVLHLYPEDTDKSNAQILRMTNIIKLYENLYIRYEYVDPVETIDLIKRLHNRIIEFDEVQLLSVDQMIMKVALMYIAWIAKERDLVIKIPFEKEIILSSKNANIGSIYAIDESSNSMYSNAISKVANANGVSIKFEPEYILLSLI